MKPLITYRPLKWMEDTEFYTQLTESVASNLLELLRDQIAAIGIPELEMYMDVLTTITDGAEEPVLIGRTVIDTRGNMVLMITVDGGSIVVKNTPFSDKQLLFDLADPKWCQNTTDYIEKWYYKTIGSNR